MIIRMTLLLALILLTGYIEAKAVPVISECNKIPVTRLELLMSALTGLESQSTKDFTIREEP